MAMATEVSYSMWVIGDLARSAKKAPRLRAGRVWTLFPHWGPAEMHLSSLALLCLSLVPGVGYPGRGAGRVERQKQ